MSREAYIASEDSALLRKALRGSSGRRFLEIGAGNGGNLVRISEGFQLVLGTDLVRPSMTDWKDVGANFILADGASCLRDHVFDLVAFNPPYLPADVEDRAVDGGSRLEVPKEFLKEALRVARRDGEVILLLNDAAEQHEFEALCEKAGFTLRLLESRKLFYEELFVFSAKARPQTLPAVGSSPAAGVPSGK